MSKLSEGFLAARVGMSFVVVVGAVLTGAMAVHAQPTSITNLGVLSGDTGSGGMGINADATVVVGLGIGNGFDRAAFRWTRASGMQNLGVLPGGALQAGAYAVTPDGSAATGYSHSTNGYRAFRWRNGFGMQDLGTLPNTYYSSGQAISTDGAAVAGYSQYLFGGAHAFRWTTAGGIQDLSTFPGGTSSVANGISADGSVVVGWSSNASGTTRAFRWTGGDGMQELGALPDGVTSIANAVSTDGSKIAGYITDPDFGNRAFRWTATGGMQDIGDFIPYAMSADGSVLAGNGEGGDLWTSTLGIVNLNVYLPTLGVDLTGWTLDRAQGVSADGTAITGTGTFNGESRGWIVTGVPTPGATALLMMGGFLVGRRRRG